MSSPTSTLTGRSAFLSVLADEGVTHLFGNPGTTELPIMDAVGRSTDLKYVLGLAEGVVVAMADGYARASGQIAACNVHVAPGLGNAMGSLYNAKWVGAPVLITAGQQEIGHGLTEPLLYDPLVPIATPMVKWATEIARIQDLPRVLRRAAKIALTPPTGPVFISLPGDILNDEADLDLGRSTRVNTATRPTDDMLEQLAQRLLAAERPAIIAGHEIATDDALSEAAGFADALGAAVYQQTVAHGSHFPSEHRCFVGQLGREQAHVRKTLSEHDLLVFVGADVLRMSVWSEVDPLPDGMPVIQLGQHDWEMGKNYPAEMALRCDLRATLPVLSETIERLRTSVQAEAAEQRVQALASRNWMAQRERLIQTLDARPDSRPMDADKLMRRLAANLPDDVVVVDESLVSGRHLPKLYPHRDHQSYFGLASGGIGFAVAGAVGIALAIPHRRVVAVIGDGSSMYNIQALWSAANQRLPITYVICNNQGYRILKERLLAYHSNDHFVGMDFTDPALDFVALAKGLGVDAERVESLDDFDSALKTGLDRNGPYLIDVRVANGFEATR